MPNPLPVFVLGAAGFIGRTLISEARANGRTVLALTRNKDAQTELSALGATAMFGCVEEPGPWIDAAREAPVLIDLVQPPLPKRIGLREIRMASLKRQALTAALLGALQRIPVAERPLLMQVSGIDDLAPDGLGCVSHISQPRAIPVGFGHIGLPVRQLVDASGLAATHVCLGTVYGPGKAFSSRIIPGLATGRFPIVGRGNNRMPLVHVQDAARALLFLADLGVHALAGRTNVVTDGTSTTQREFLSATAQMVGASPPRRIPAWIAAWAAGRILVEVMTRDVAGDPSTWASTGFNFLYPSYHSGMPATLKALGLQPAVSIA
jgi:nucleoside-diphosphate-sugar epimerase